jgi:G:T-mismatch repair DNA endonuclease (very short patch repair protein)
MMNETVTCMICGKEFATRITPSHLKTHNISMSEYKENYPNSQLVTAACAKNSCITLQNQINKYGLEEGTRRFNEYVEKQRYAGCSLEYFQTKYGNEEGLLKYNHVNNKRAVSLQNQINKYGLEEGTRRFNEYVEKQRYAGCSLEYFQTKYGNEEGLNRYKTVNQLKKFTLQNQINKYGLEEGTKRFNEIILSRNKIKYASSILATKIINLILSHLPENIAANAKCLQTEFFIHRNNKLYFYDLTFPKYKKIIEINGDYWHANPILYHHDDIINFPNKIKNASDVWEYDFNKMKHVIDYGFDIKYIWEYDFNKNTNQTINEVVKWILN